MIIKPTPFPIASVALFLLGIYYIFSGSNLGPPAGFIIILFGSLFLLAYFGIRSVTQNKIRTQFIIELVLLVTVFVAVFKINNKVVLHPKKDFSGYIFIVYEVDKKPALEPKSIFSHTIDLVVPDSGIIFTSSKPPNGYTNKISVDDSLKGELLPGYGVPFSMDSLTCGGKKYAYDVLLIGKQPSGWKLIRKSKAELVCKILSEP